MTPFKITRRQYQLLTNDDTVLDHSTVADEMVLTLSDGKFLVKETNSSSTALALTPYTVEDVLTTPLLHEFTCHKHVHAIPVEKGPGAITLGRECSAGEFTQEGYLVVYSKGTDDQYISWSPKRAFEDGYFRTHDISDVRGTVTPDGDSPQVDIFGLTGTVTDAGNHEAEIQAIENLLAPYNQSERTLILDAAITRLVVAGE